jgi:hypothetical protein
VFCCCCCGCSVLCLTTLCCFCCCGCSLFALERCVVVFAVDVLSCELRHSINVVVAYIFSCALERCVLLLLWMFCLMHYSTVLLRMFSLCLRALCCYCCCGCSVFYLTTLLCFCCCGCSVFALERCVIVFVADVLSCALQHSVVGNVLSLP